MVGQISGVVVAAVAVLRYEQLNDWAVRLFGIGGRRWIAGRLWHCWLVVGLIALALGMGRHSESGRPGSRREQAPIS